MTTDDIIRASRLFGNEILIRKVSILFTPSLALSFFPQYEELQRSKLQLDSFKKIKENQEKIKLNKQFPYLVGNIVKSCHWAC
ncbi:26S protease regulatory subunit 6A-like [Quillaja saponaria]|uniref:26S protease regulatory subunit 6A-like n=1 Tax=Quillaja saponaria TaxID=32244 RepID=A0AAD7LQH2_QUISA|nr:26S protease regulatory subunit 6A-like [Quillaja saponaria]